MASKINEHQQQVKLPVLGNIVPKRATQPAAAVSMLMTERIMTERKRTTARDYRTAMMEEAFAPRKALFECGQLLDRETLRQRLGISELALCGWLRRRSLFHVDGPSGARYCPAFLADPAYSPTVLAAVSRALGTLPGSTKWVFFTNPRGSLGGLSPLEILAGRRPPGDTASGVGLETILRAARAEVEF